MFAQIFNFHDPQIQLRLLGLYLLALTLVILGIFELDEKRNRKFTRALMICGLLGSISVIYVAYTISK